MVFKDGSWSSLLGRSEKVAIFGPCVSETSQTVRENLAKAPGEPASFLRGSRFLPFLELLARIPKVFVVNFKVVEVRRKIGLG